MAMSVLILRYLMRVRVSLMNSSFWLTEGVLLRVSLLPFPQDIARYTAILWPWKNWQTRSRCCGCGLLAACVWLWTSEAIGQIYCCRFGRRVYVSETLLAKRLVDSEYVAVGVEEEYFSVLHLLILATVVIQVGSEYLRIGVDEEEALNKLYASDQSLLQSWGKHTFQVIMWPAITYNDLFKYYHLSS